MNREVPLSSSESQRTTVAWVSVDLLILRMPLTGLCGIPLNQIFDEERDVFRALAEGQHLDWKDIEQGRIAT